MRWKLSIPTVKSAFMDSQSGEELGAAQASATDEMALLSFSEFQEFVARVGLDKYRPIKAMTPAAAVRAMHQNILGEKNEEQAVVEATRITATGYDATTLAVALPGEGDAELAKWLDCWGRMAFMDMYMYPLWEKEVRVILLPLPTRTHPHPPTHTHRPSHTLTHPHTPSHTLTHPHTPTHTLIHTPSPSYTLTHPPLPSRRT